MMFAFVAHPSAWTGISPSNSDERLAFFTRFNLFIVYRRTPILQVYVPKEAASNYSTDRHKHVYYKINKPKKAVVLIMAYQM
jgi:hypothetical protein